MATSKDQSINPLADKAFDAIDISGDGTIQPDEIIAYLVKEFGPEPAMKLLKVIDKDQDGAVSREEWHKAWREGDFEIEEVESTEVQVTGKGTFRVLSRHFSNPNMFKRNFKPHPNSGPKSAQSPKLVKSGKRLPLSFTKKGSSFRTTPRDSREEQDTPPARVLDLSRRESRASKEESSKSKKLLSKTGSRTRVSAEQ